MLASLLNQNVEKQELALDQLLAQLVFTVKMEDANLALPIVQPAFLKLFVRPVFQDLRSIRWIIKELNILTVLKFAVTEEDSSLIVMMETKRKAMVVTKIVKLKKDGIVKVPLLSELVFV